jgi:hypothetical protein
MKRADSADLKPNPRQESMQMTLIPFQPGDRVFYVPLHAGGDLDHENVMRGQVSSLGSNRVFVKFDNHVSLHGWDGATAQACDPGNLRAEGEMSDPAIRLQNLETA